MILDQASIAALEKSELGGALEHGNDSTQNHETHTGPELLRAQRRIRDDFEVEVSASSRP